MGEFSGSSESEPVLVIQVYLKVGWVGWMVGWNQEWKKKDDNVVL